MLRGELSPELASKIALLVGDGARLPFGDDVFDVVVSFSVIDHIPSAEARAAAVAEMCRVLRPGGHLVLTLPNRWNLPHHLLSQRAQRRGTSTYGYAYFFSPLEARAMITRHGMEILACESTAFNPLSALDRILRRLQVGKLFTYFGARFGFLARKR